MVNEIIDIGLLESGEVNLSLKGYYSIIHSGENFTGKAVVRISDGLLLFDCQGVQIKGKEIILVPSNPDSDCFSVDKVKIGIDFHWEQERRLNYTGGIKCIQKAGKVILINRLPLENYLESVISSEMSPGCSPELLKAHAVISRSWVLYQIINRKSKNYRGSQFTCSEDEHISWMDREDHEDYHICADDHCQRYQGLSGSHTRKVKKAIEATRGLVLFYGEDICDARYSKSCGGYTERFETCWENSPKPYLLGFPDVLPQNPGYFHDLTSESEMKRFIDSPPPAFCNTKDPKVLRQVLKDYDYETKDFFRWEVRYSSGELRNIIKKRSGRDFGRLISIDALERGPSGRIIRLRIKGSDKTMVAGKELTIRRWLSPSHLYSSAFIIEKFPEKDEFPEEFVFKGSGWGHGVGMCQIGAAVMAESGYSYEQILSHYYKNTQIRQYNINEAETGEEHIHHGNTQL